MSYPVGKDSAFSMPEGMSLAEERSIEDTQIRAVRRCVWPKCRKPPMRDPDLWRPVPLCAEHARQAWARYSTVNSARNEQKLEQWEEFRKSPRERRDEAVRLAHEDGAIYFIRLNDVIKIGWTSQLHVRLRDYTAGAVLLAHHPGSRADERDLHRTFKPFRVHGREWYDGNAGILLDHIAGVVAKYGPPAYTVERNAVKAPIGHKHWTGKR